MATHVAVNRDPANAPTIERTMREFFDRFGDAVDPIAADLETAIRRGDVDLGTLRSIRAEVGPRMGGFANDLEVVFREHGEQSAEAGRAIAARRQSLDIAFDTVPRRTLAQLDDWATTASEYVADSMEAEITNYLRGAHEEGLSVDEVADQFQDELVEGRIKDSKADQLARDNTVAPSNAGNHSALRDAEGIVGEEWIDTSDGRTRDTHAAAGGQVVAVDQPFVVGGYRAEHPGDPSLPPEEFTRCRCTVVGVFRDELTDGQYQRLVAGQRIWR
jgi:hypothetical protein